MILKRNAGFTLIELLVVVAVIGILATVILGSLSSAREKTQISSRISQVQELKKAINLYVLDHDQFPITTTNTDYCLGKTDSETCWGGRVSGDDDLNTALEPYISLTKFSEEPDEDGRGYIIYTGATPLGGCSSNKISGDYILWWPEDTHPTSNEGCYGNGSYSCCANGTTLCASGYAGYYCALPINDF